MKVTSKPAIARVIRQFEVPVGPVIRPDGYQRSYRVDSGTIEYVWRNGSFVAESIFAIRLDGPWVKRDGTDAKDRATGMRPTGANQELAEDYRWLKPVIDRLRPQSDLSMTSLHNYEVKV